MDFRGLRKAVAALPGLRSLAGVGGQPCAATTPAGDFRLWAGGSGECAQTPHRGKDRQGRAATPATTLSPTKRGAGNSSARRRERYRAWDLALSYGPRRRETLRACLWDGGGYWPHAERKPAHGASGNGGNWSIETLLRFLLFGQAGVDA